MEIGNQNPAQQRLENKDAEYLDNKDAQQREARRQRFHALVNKICDSRRNDLWVAAREVKRMGSESAGADEPDWDAMPEFAKDFHVARLAEDGSRTGGAQPLGTRESEPDDLDGVPAFRPGPARGCR